MSDPAPRRRPRLVGVLIISLIALVAIAAIASLSLDEGEIDPIEIDGAGSVQRLVGGIRQLEERLGEGDAPVSIEVFNDLQCEDCADYHRRVIEPLIEQQVRPGEVKLHYRHFSMSERASGLASFGAVAAAEQHHQWQFIDLFFRNQDEAARRGVTQELLDRLAGAILEFNVEQWQRDLEDPEIQETLDADAELAARRRLPAEPAVVVTGPRGDRELTDSPSLEQIEAAIAEVR